MKSLVVGEDNKNYGEICSTDKNNISRLRAAGSKKTPLCYSKVKYALCLLTVLLYSECFTTQNRKNSRKPQKNCLMIIIEFETDPSKTFLVDIRLDGLLQNTTGAQGCDPPASDETRRFVLPNQGVTGRKYQETINMNLEHTF